MSFTLMPKIVPKQGLLLKLELASKVGYSSAAFADFYIDVNWVDLSLEVDCLLQGLFLHQQKVVSP